MADTRRTRRTAAHPEVRSATFIDLTDELVLKIMTACSVRSKMQLAKVNQRFAALLAVPAKNSKLWGTLTLRKADLVAVHQPMQLVPWLVQRVEGIEAVVFGWPRLRPNPVHDEEELLLLHTMLFTLAGALAGSHINLQVWALPDESEYNFDPMPFPAHLWSPAGCMMLAKCLTKFEMTYDLTNPAHDLACLCSLSSLEEADLCLDARGVPELRQWEPPQPGLSSLRRLRLTRCSEPCAAALLAATGPNLTRLHTTWCFSEPELMDAIAGLTSLRQLKMDHLDYDTTPSFTSLRVLTELTIETAAIEADFRILGSIDWAFLTTFPALRKLTLDGYIGVTDSLASAILALPLLQHLSFLDGHEWWRRTATQLGRLRDRLSAERPSCTMSLTELYE